MNRWTNAAIKCFTVLFMCAGLNCRGWRFHTWQDSFGNIWSSFCTFFIETTESSLWPEYCSIILPFGPAVVFIDGHVLFKSTSTPILFIWGLDWSLSNKHKITCVLATVLANSLQYKRLTGADVCVWKESVCFFFKIKANYLCNILKLLRVLIYSSKLIVFFLFFVCYIFLAIMFFNL